MDRRLPGREEAKGSSKGCGIGVDNGVSQGSLLGPLLFVTYLNDIGRGLSNRMLKFADVAKVMGSVVMGKGK